MPDEVGFYHDLTARQNLRYTAELNRLPRPVALERIEQVLDQVRLTDAADTKVGAFSRGMRQRLGVADALVKRPSILILDEPTVNIDPDGVRELLLLIERLRTEQGVTVLLSSHLLHQVQQVCDRIGIFVRGQLRACGTIDSLAHEIGDRWTFTVGVTDLDAPAEILARVPGVHGVSRNEGRWSVQADADVRPAIHDAVVEHGGRFTHLSRDEADLDVIYHRYFHDADADGADRAQTDLLR
jgi:ABC-2 type transport system ATP-binding protein